MTHATFWQTVLQPNVDALPWSSGVTNSKQSRVLLMAAAGHETNWMSRVQIPGGQARGYWQSQENGHILGVLNDPRAGRIARAFCASRDIPCDIKTVFEAIAWHDALALVIARLALWMDLSPLPSVGDEAGALNCYLRVWRPGKPLPSSWTVIYQQALTVVV